METTKLIEKQTTKSATLRDDWLNRLDELIAQIDGWAQEQGWSTRRITKKLRDSEVGDHLVPALILQKETARVLLEPIARSAPGADGVVDLYLLPAYDDIASLYFIKGKWQLHYMWSGTPTVATTRKAKPKPLSSTSFHKVLEEMVNNVAEES